jgi:hypothetical protein
MADFWDRFKNVVRSEWNSVFSDEDGQGVSVDSEAFREAHRAAIGGVDGHGMDNMDGDPALARPSVASAFRLLDLHPTASLDEVRHSYFELARHYYPLVTGADAQRASNARSVIFSLTEAYEVLCEHLVPLHDGDAAEGAPAG